MLLHFINYDEESARSDEVGKILVWMLSWKKLELSAQRFNIFLWGFFFQIFL